MDAWLLWLIAAGVLAAAEVATTTLVLAMLAGGAAAGAVTAALGAPAVVQIVVALVATVALLGLVRPAAQRRLAGGADARSGADALVGMQAVVLRAVGPDDGRVRLNGAEWSARSYDPDTTLPAGSRVRVVEISGATALVLAEPAS